ncbi:MAG: undecaprenyl-diphosphate phosphatase [Gordonia sp. (in: high G+C Gram-positive bacteria)]|uniref:undecaprenyl-diphosphate phosphatase n=1 Tax=Gordonia sp. (in: high G+C Gram-positive bacteria) TaxID=84139 RepID=UPI0039E26766
MTWLQLIVLSIVQGLTEFLPISSSGHIFIVSRLFWNADAGASFTAVTQLGTEAAVLVYFGRDIFRIIRAWFAGLRNPRARGMDYRIGWAVIVATIPIGIIGLLFASTIRDGLRNLWITAIVLIGFSGVFWLAERVATQRRTLEDVTMRDAVVVGLAQSLALIPGVSRSGSSASAGLFLGLNREAAFRLSFLLAVPAVLASGFEELPKALGPSTKVGETVPLMTASGAQLLASVVITFLIGYAAIAWLLKFVEHHSLNWFGAYRVALGVFLIVLLATNTIPAR